MYEFAPSIFCYYLIKPTTLDQTATPRDGFDSATENRARTASAWASSATARSEVCLEVGAREHLGNRTEKDPLAVSGMYGWFQGNFDGDDAGMINHLRRYAKAIRPHL